VTGTRRRVLQELAATGALPRIARWHPVVAGWLLGAVVLVWKADDVHDATGAATLLRIVALLLVTGVVGLVDDDAANLLASVPVPLAWRTGLRFGLAATAVAAPWAGALLWVRPGHPAAALTLECAAITAFGLAVASGIARWSNAREAGLAAGPAVLAAAVFAVLLPPRWALFAPPGDAWRDAHVRWAAVLCVAMAVLLLTLRDPARRDKLPLPEPGGTK
jgi:fluoroquinolone transport system permease protein